eukprot:TRINITY_DN602_c0_g4_i1.p1 TRINITY_DN602_c0_g4~~TRINITY_DN602_c0_g4_i1.p1  ORF type:complete len:1061 (-),score=238.28 TRINITY_DN602_c0_g4_i1:127-3309(-)
MADAETSTLMSSSHRSRASSYNSMRRAKLRFRSRRIRNAGDEARGAGESTPLRRISANTMDVYVSGGVPPSGASGSDVEIETGCECLERILQDSFIEEDASVAGLKRLDAGARNELDVDVVTEVVREDEGQLSSCASLPFTVLYFFIFMIFFQIYYQITDIYLAERMFRSHCSDPSVSISDPVKIYDWLDDTLFANIWGATDSYSAAEQRGTPFLLTELVGGVSLSVTSLDPPGEEPCLSCAAPPAAGNGTGRLLWGEAFGAGAPAAAFAGAEPLVQWLPAGALHAGVSTRAARRGFAPGGDWEEDERPMPQRLGRRKRRWLKGLATWLPALSSSDRRADARRQQELAGPVDRRLRLSRADIRPYVGHIRNATTASADFVVPGTWERPRLQEFVRGLRERDVLRESTTSFTTRSLLLHNISNRELLTMASVQFTLDRGGGVFSWSQIITLVLSESDDMWYVMLGPSCVVCLLAFSCMLPQSARTMAQEGRFVEDFFKFWNVMEWLIVLIGWAVMLNWLIERGQSWEVQDSLRTFKESRAKNEGLEFSAEDKQLYQELLDKTINACNTATLTQAGVANYHVLLVLRFFMAVRGHPRVAIVLNTVQKASTDLLHLFVVSLVIFCAFAASGHLLFGRRIPEFATFESAFSDCFEIVMEREYQWEEFTTQDTLTSTIWIWSLVFLVTLVFVNIFLAIVFDSYGHVRSAVHDEATLWRTTRHLYRQVKTALQLSKDDCQWIPNKTLISIIGQMRTNTISPWMLRDALPAIDANQVAYVFGVASWRQEKKALNDAASMLPALMCKILFSVVHLLHDLHGFNEPPPEGQSRKTVQDNARDFVLSIVGWANEANETLQNKPESLTEQKAAGVLSEEPSSGRRPSAEASKSFGSAGSAAEEEVLPPPEDAPLWVTTQLLPHLQRSGAALAKLNASAAMLIAASGDTASSQGVNLQKMPDTAESLAAMLWGDKLSPVSADAVAGGKRTVPHGSVRGGNGHGNGSAWASGGLAQGRPMNGSYGKAGGLQGSLAAIERNMAAEDAQIEKERAALPSSVWRASGDAVTCGSCR